jgi:hypothetical protein
MKRKGAFNHILKSIRLPLALSKYDYQRIRKNRRRRANYQIKNNNHKKKLIKKNKNKKKSKCETNEKYFKEFVVQNNLDHYMLKNIYYQKNAVLNKKTCIIIKWAEIFGSGDKMFVLKTCKIILNHYPDIKIFLYPECSYDGYISIINSFKDIPNCKICLANSWHTSIKYYPQYYAEYYKDISRLCNLESTISRFKLKDSHKIILDVATPNPYFKLLQDYPHGTKSYYHIDEYCGHRSYDYYEKLEWDYNKIVDSNMLVAGVGYNGYIPAIGIHIDPRLHWKNNIDKDKLYFSLENENLKKRLKKNSKLFFAYISPEQDQNNFTVLYSFIKSIKNLDKCKTNPFHFVVVNKYFDNEYFNNFIKKKLKPNSINPIYNLGMIGLHCHNSQYNFELTVINRLSNNDMKRMMLLSEPEILVTGDQSLTEALSIGDKIIFYQIQPWKTNFFCGLYSIALEMEKNKLLEGRILTDFLEVQKKFNDYDYCVDFVNLNDNRLHQNFIKFSEFICQHYDFEKYMIGIIKKDILGNTQNGSAEKIKNIERRLIRNYETIIKKKY